MTDHAAEHFLHGYWDMVARETLADRPRDAIEIARLAVAWLDEPAHRALLAPGRYEVWRRRFESIASANKKRLRRLAADFARLDPPLRDPVERLPFTQVTDSPFRVTAVERHGERLVIRWLAPEYEATLDRPLLEQIEAYLRDDLGTEYEGGSLVGDTRDDPHNYAKGGGQRFLPLVPPEARTLWVRHLDYEVKLTRT